MAHFINVCRNPRTGRTMYQYHRRTLPTDYNAARTMWGEDAGQARVFTTQGAATRSAARFVIAHVRDFRVVEVNLVPIDTVLGVMDVFNNMTDEEYNARKDRYDDKN